METRPFVGDVRERCVRSPASLGRSAGNKKAEEHDRAANRECPEAGRVYFWKCHVRCADLQRHYEVSEGRKCYWHHPEKDHDRAVHRTEGVVTLRRHHAVRKWTDQPAQPEPGIEMSGCRLVRF